MTAPPIEGDIATKAFGAELEVKADGIFIARVYVTGGPPDADGDLILPGAISDGHSVQVSLAQHDSMPPPRGQSLPPAGEAKLFHMGRCVVAVGQANDTPRGILLREQLMAKGYGQEWSIGWHPPTAIVRPPTEEESKSYPDTRRVYEKWTPFEISPVGRGACGPTCRTLGAKCAGTCSCQGDAKQKDAAAKRLQEEIDQDIARWQRTRRAFRL